MNIQKIGQPEIIMSNPESLHNYFAWPTVARLKNGRIVAGASGFRLAHICPFGKCSIAFSEDEGETFTGPIPVIDTVLDDRDVGLCPFGESGLIVTSFNNTVEFQRSKGLTRTPAYRDAYLDQVTPEAEKKALGSTFRISRDNGVTFGPIFHSPATSPHGPVELKDGTILWVGRTHSKNDTDQGEQDFVGAYRLCPDTGEVTLLGRVEAVEDEQGHLLSCEPHAIELPDGTLLCHIRIQRYISGKNNVFTIYQTRSKDGGKTWEKPYAILPRLGGSPPHLLMLSSGALICTYGYREKPCAIRMMYSPDNGETWDTGHTLVDGYDSDDLGYPSTIELKDHSLLTVYYARKDKKTPAVIYQQKWMLEE